jgi:hypothetical protein
MQYFHKVTGKWRKLHNEEFNNMSSKPNIVRMIKPRRIKLAVHVARIEEGRGVYRILVGKPERKRLLGRHRCRWEDNIKMDLQQVRVGVWAGWCLLRIEAGGGHLCIR